MSNTLHRRVLSAVAEDGPTITALASAIAQEDAAAVRSILAGCGVDIAPAQAEDMIAAARGVGAEHAGA